MATLLGTRHGYTRDFWSGDNSKAPQSHIKASPICWPHPAGFHQGRPYQRLRQGTRTERHPCSESGLLCPVRDKKLTIMRETKSPLNGPQEQKSKTFNGLPGGSMVRIWSHGFDPWSGKIPHASGNQASAPQLWKLCSRAREQKPLKPHVASREACGPRVCAPQQEKPPQREACASQLGRGPTHCN